MIEDFNNTTGHNKKEAGMQCFDSSVLTFNRMMIIEFWNFIFWKYDVLGKKKRTVTVRSRLDQAVVNEDWHKNLIHYYFQYLCLWRSDHRLVLDNILVKQIKARIFFIIYKC